jgi:NRAMP (natural resistance-associated macrophage protein)-like metal ion transporter
MKQGSHAGKLRWLLLLTTIGPGLTVMLADTDAGSIITAAQSGAQWGYKLLALQLILIPILYIVQELTVRIGITTGKGHAELIRDTFGSGWAWLSVVTLFITAIGALITEFAGIAGVSILFGIPQWIMILSAALVLILISFTGKYKIVERIAIFVGLFELIFILVAVFSKPDFNSIIQSAGKQPFSSRSYWVLIAANVGAVIMPWMLFYQQGAVVDKGLSHKVINYSRLDTAAGSILTQVIMCSVLIVAAATIGLTNPNAPLDSVQQIANAITPFLGSFMGRILFAIGITGAALVAAIVVSLAASWAYGEVLKVRCSLNCTWKEAPVFYSLYSGAIILSAAIVLLGIPLISLTIAIEVMNALLLPIVLGFLIALGWKVLPEQYRLLKWEKFVLIIIYLLICSLGIYTVFQL